MPRMQENPLVVNSFQPELAELSYNIKKFHRMKQIRRGPMHLCALHKMMQKFERTGKLCVLLGIERNQIKSCNIESVVSMIAEVSSQLPHVKLPAFRCIGNPVFHNTHFQ
ncbi:hypothetical protein TNCV_986031 [Trichonephila clavipes]|uniref:Uncharacterized protein n=1 Tax=Trichonephila clavipes TaxID=2585209 RepID=A0A8X6SKF1_TRICX|nr:hypothetical protein TNCV_986031 [Trichonephila clavipes]